MMTAKETTYRRQANRPIIGNEMSQTHDKDVRDALLTRMQREGPGCYHQHLVSPDIILSLQPIAVVKNGTLGQGRTF